MFRRTPRSTLTGTLLPFTTLFRSVAVTELGGFIHDPGGMVWGHPRGADAAIMLQTGLETGEVEAGTHVMFDCHGTIDQYCWDGGNTWVVGGEPEGPARRFSEATVTVATDLPDAMRARQSVV